MAQQVEVRIQTFGTEEGIFFFPIFFYEARQGPTKRGIVLQRPSHGFL